MQSIWRGKSENIFASDTERRQLAQYTKRAIDFAALIGCGNLVFGCPNNRRTSGISNVEKISVSFFKEIGDYAWENGTCVALEALPPIYNTNYINTTKQAIELIQKVGSKGFLLNLDVGTMIQIMSRSICYRAMWILLIMFILVNRIWCQLRGENPMRNCITI